MTQRFIGHDVDARRLQFRKNLFAQASCLVCDHRQDAFSDFLELLPGSHAVSREFGNVFLQLLLESGHANHEKLIQVGEKIDRNFSRLQYRIALVKAFLQHAAMKLKQAQLAIEEETSGVFRGREERWAVERSAWLA